MSSYDRRAVGRKKISIIKIIFLFGWLGLFAALMWRDHDIKSLDQREIKVLRRDREERYLGVYFQKERIGFVKSRLMPADGEGFVLEQLARLNLRIMNDYHPVEMRVTAELTAALLLRSFDFTINSPFSTMAVRGTVDDRTVRFTMSTGKETVYDRVRLAGAPYLNINQRGYLLRRNLEPGDRIQVPYFDPLTLSGNDVTLEYKGLEKVLIKDRVQNLHHFVEHFSGMRINSWLDKQGNLVKEESPAGFVMLAEPEFKATDIKAPAADLLRSVSVPVTGGMVDLKNLTTISYRLTWPKEGDFQLNRGRQHLSADVLTISLEKMPGRDAMPCRAATDSLAATPYIQADHPHIRELGREICAEAADSMSKVEALAAWVYENLEKRPEIMVPDALSTLDRRRGDCNEHAALFAALARSMGIPARIVAGLTFSQGAFYYHAWNEVCLDDSWLSLDTTINQIPADLGHIAFVVGETKEQIKIGALLGRLQIEVVR